MGSNESVLFYFLKAVKRFLLSIFEKSGYDYLEDEVFANQEATVLEPEVSGIKSFSNYMKHYKEVLHVERTAVDHFK